MKKGLFPLRERGLLLSCCAVLLLAALEPALFGTGAQAGDVLLVLPDHQGPDAQRQGHPGILGGGQQGGMRSGTENVPGIAGIAKAAQIMYDNYDQDIEKLYDLKKCFIEGVKKIDRVIVNGPDCMDGAPHIVSVSFSGVRSEVLLHSLEDKGIYVSAGSACSAHKPQPSATLMAMGVPKDLLSSTIRFSFSVFTTMEEINYTLEALYDIIPMLRKYTRK